MCVVSSGVSKLATCISLAALNRTKGGQHRRVSLYRGAYKSLARLGRKQATATKDFDIHVSYLLS